MIKINHMQKKGYIKESIFRADEPYLTKSFSQTKNLGKYFASALLFQPKGPVIPRREHRPKGAVIFGLEGDLGAGKTVFLQGFARGLRIKEKVLSPTFVIMRRFKINNSCFKNFYHFDCYRIENPEDVLILGFKEIISNSQNIVAIEWADRIQKILPKRALILKFQFVNKNKRKIMLK
jgi:tRNA threonylcarbamoyladenosine biosynthesis protein TsaE